jgi:hypothetical protein
MQNLNRRTVVQFQLEACREAEGFQLLFAVFGDFDAQILRHGCPDPFWL